MLTLQHTLELGFSIRYNGRWKRDGFGGNGLFNEEVMREEVEQVGEVGERFAPDFGEMWMEKIGCKGIE